MPRKIKKKRTNTSKVLPEKKKQQYTLAFGIFFLAVSLVFLLSFSSYLFHGEADHDIVHGSFQDALAVKDKLAENNLGIFGAFLSHWFIYKWFGYASFGFIPILFLSAFRMVTGKDLLAIDLSKLAKASLFYILFISAFVGYFVFQFDLSFHATCGGIGFRINEFLDKALGAGGIVVLLTILFFWLVFFHGFTKIDDRVLNWMNKKKSSKRVEEAKEEEEEPEPEPIVSYSVDEKFLPNSTPSKPFTGGIPLEIETNEKNYQDKDNEDLVLEIEESADSQSLFEEDTSEELLEEFGPYDPKLDLASYTYPPISLMLEHKGGSSKVTPEELEANKVNIVETMRNFNIGISSIKATIGPTVTLYEIIPEAGIRISKIKNLEDDIALSLAALGIRIIAPMPGKGTIGIEVPNKSRELVSMRSVLESDKFQKTSFELPIILGKTISNEIFVADLAKMPHLLMAGATGQGKSVGINVILASLLYKKHPAEVKFVMVDPKKVELSLFNKIERHFLARLPNSEDAIITDTKKVIYTLNSLCIEMDNRYDLLKDAGVRNIREYNAKFTRRKLNPENGHQFLPYIVLVIDELADLMMTAGKEVEQPIARLAQLARAIGIHLIVATQRPSVNVITGIIKANFPARLSFKVTAKVDSRTILDTGGAEQLVGNGDMLLAVGSDMVRLQCPFVDTPEIEEVCDFIGSQRAYPSAYMLPEFSGDEESDALEFDPNDLDPKFEEAAKLIVTLQQGSTSLIQRKMKLGYNRAGRIMDQLEGAGIVGPFEGSKAREVLILDLESLEVILTKLR